MSKRIRTCWSLIIVGLLASVLPQAKAADPPSIMSIFRKKQPIPEGSTELKAEHGPWMILATTVSGDDAATRAAALAEELRIDLRLPCYVMEKTIGDNQTLATRERVRTDRYGNLQPSQLEIKYANEQTISAYAVLVGEFNSTEDPRIKDALQRVRVAKPRALVETSIPADAEDDSNWIVKRYRSVLWSRTDREANQQKGPMGAAFVTRNPLLPDDYFQAPVLDEFVEGLNREKLINYSLLDCPGRFTVRVASFRGNEVTDFGNGARASQLNDEKQALVRAGDQAHDLTEALRKKGKEAYEFHDRFGSYVTIGSFDVLGQELESGQFQFHPGIVAILNEHCGYQVVEVKDPATGGRRKQTTLKSESKIPFDVEGKPMAVPRPETSKLYRGSLLGGR